MTTIHTGSYHAPASFRSDITLPPAPPREHLDPATTVVLQHASGVSLSDLPAPDQALFNGAVQIRLDQITNGYLPNVRKVLAECDVLQDDVIKRRREREAQEQNTAWELGYKVTTENDKASGLQRNGKFIQSGGQILSGVVETSTASAGLYNKSTAGSKTTEAVQHEKAAASEQRQQKTEGREITQLERHANKLESSRNGDAEHDARIDQELAKTRGEIARKQESQDSRRKVIDEENHAANKARDSARHLERDDTELALARGLSACLNGAAGMGAAQLDHEGDLKKNYAQRLQLWADQEKSVASRAGEGASEAQSARAKYLEISAEVTHLERPNYS